MMSHLTPTMHLGYSPSSSPSRKVLPSNGTKTTEQNRSPSVWTMLRRLALLLAMLVIAKVTLMDIGDPSQQMIRRSDVVAQAVVEANPAVVAAAAAIPAANTNKKNKHRPSLHLVGERHSGTKWIYAHLQDCFGQDVSVRSGLTRWKHWFQEDGEYSTFMHGGTESEPGDRTTVVVAQFRNPFDWTEAMRVNPYHSPEHFGLEWHEFVNKTWTMPRHGKDVGLEGTAVNSSTSGTGTCLYDFRPDQVIPCLETENVIVDESGREVHSVYEMQNDGSGEPFDNLLQLRAAKIRHFLSIAHFAGVQDLFPVQYEVMTRNGTASLIRNLEQALGVKAKCSPTEPVEPTIRPVSPEYVKWMNEHVDWEAEALIGYDPATI